MVLGYKTGGRVKGSRNKAKVDTSVAADEDTAPAAGAAPGAVLDATRARARSADLVAGSAMPAFPKSRLARVDSLVPNERNPRSHTRESVDALARQIEVYGWTNPILVAGKNNHILAGHRRRLAAIQRKMVVVPVIDLGHLNAKQRRAYIIWDNKSTIDGEWDEGLLAELLSEARDEGFADLTGFDHGELSALLDDPEPLEPPPKRTTTKTVECPNCHHSFAP